MNDEFLLCDQCVHFLGKHSSSLVTLWMALCREYVNGETTLRVPIGEYDSIEFMEKNGFLTTHETEKELFIRVDGLFHDDVDDEDFFCANLDEHYPIMDGYKE